MKERFERLLDNSDDLDAIVIVNGTTPIVDSTFWYLTEQTSGSFEGSFAIATREGLNVIVNTLEEETARSGKGNVKVYRTRDERDGLIKESLRRCKKVGFNYPYASYASVEYVKKVADFKIVNASPAIDATVNVKDEKEIGHIREACRISSIVAGEIPDYLSEGVTEREVANKMDRRMLELGGHGNAFDTIAAFGRYSSEPHHMPCDYSLRKGDTALFDFGTKYNGYCSDMTRTVFLGKPEDVLLRAYEIVREAQELGVQEYYDGAPAKDADLAAREHIDGTEFKGLFIHSFGHGIGMEVHQGISISPKSEQALVSGNVISAEPGIYIPGVGGIRIEDTCLITDSGFERLTSFDRNLTLA